MDSAVTELQCLYHRTAVQALRSMRPSLKHNIDVTMYNILQHAAAMDTITVSCFPCTDASASDCMFKMCAGQWRALYQHGRFRRCLAHIDALGKTLMNPFRVTRGTWMYYAHICIAELLRLFHALDVAGAPVYLFMARQYFKQIRPTMHRVMHHPDTPVPHEDAVRLLVQRGVDHFAGRPGMRDPLLKLNLCKSVELCTPAASTYMCFAAALNNLQPHAMLSTLLEHAIK
ncbi:ORF103 [Ranid herpesvirus 1]|uniref:ORF103 n=1 Tax=Ranid herpesvirus 1 TaxID=85655 RepID=Q14VM7_9VIRU|nr:ORF103 [Ranid herpesvirus 1]ABG25789.1 ORF103 [Ranid herpesvirus 1]